jgi:signal transduction histidine kinase
MAESGLAKRLLPRIHDLARNVSGRNTLLAVACFVGGVASHKLVSLQPGQPIVWLPMGMALAGVLLWGRDVWPGVLAGVGLANALCGLPWLHSLGSAVGDTVGVLVARRLLERFGQFRLALERVQDVLALFYFGVLAAAAVSASILLCAVAVGGQVPASQWLTTWWTWWLMSSLGMLALTPLALTWQSGSWRLWEHRRFREALGLMALLVATSLLVFGETYPSRLAGYSVAYVVFAYSLWSALRLGPRGAATVVLVVAALSARGTVRGFGPFAVEVTEEVALLWSVFNGVFALCTLVLAAVMAERRSDQEALLTSEARYRHLFSHAPISIWEEDYSALVAWLGELRRTGLTNLKAHLEAHPEAASRASSLVRVTDVNDVTLKMFEAERREQLLGDLSRLLHHDTRPFFLEEVLAVWEGKLHFSNEVSGYTLKGRRIDYLLHWDASTETGEPDWQHVIIAILDITERQRLREQFRQAQKMEAVGRLAGGIAHDFNNLIMTIQGYSSLLLSDPATSAAQREEVEQIHRAAERASSLTRQLLAFSRKQVLRSRELALNAVVEEMNKMLRRLLGENIEFEKRLAPDLGWVKADPGQIEQVIMNLAINARDAMPKGGKLTLQTANAEVDGQPVPTETGPLLPRPYVTLTVSDTGCGMSPTVKAHLFEPFFTTKGAERGTGLGLSTVYGIIKQSGGEIAVASTEGEGTRFTIYLPRVEGPQV